MSINVEISNMEIKDLDLISNNLNTDFDDFWNYNIFKSELENGNSKYLDNEIAPLPVNTKLNLYLSNLIIRFSNKLISFLILSILLVNSGCSNIFALPNTETRSLVNFKKASKKALNTIS